MKFQKAVVPPRRANRRSPIMDRFWAKTEVRPGSSCWWWLAHRQGRGYGQFSENKVVVSAHRWAYERFVGPIPAGLHIDHLCNNPSCVKPTHLEPVTQAENNHRTAARNRGVRW